MKKGSDSGARKFPQRHAMVDLETVGTAPGSAILTIGAIRFDVDADDLGADGVDPFNLGPGRSFYMRVDRDSGLNVGLTEDADTLDWWSRQTPEARAEAFDAAPRARVSEALSGFARWFAAGSEFIWSHGSGFDVVLLEAAMRLTGIAPSWKYCNARDTRTLYDFTGVRPVRDANHHHALHDALAQAAAVQLAYRRAKEGPAVEPSPPVGEGRVRGTP